MTGMIFLTKSHQTIDSLELSLESGQAMIRIKIGHYEKEIMIGQSLNDDIYHTLTFRRRGNVIEANIDEENPKKGKVQNVKLILPIVSFKKLLYFQ